MHIQISALQNVFPGSWLFWSSGSPCSQCLCCGRGYVRFAEWHLLCCYVAGAAASAVLGNIGYIIKIGKPSVENVSSHLSPVLLKWCHWTFVLKCLLFQLLCCSQWGPVVCCNWDFCSFEFLVKNGPLHFLKSKRVCFNLQNLKIIFLSYFKKIFVCCQTAAY